MWARTSAFAALVLVVACKREPAPTSAAAEPKAKAVAFALPCPAGTVQRGAAPPDGQRVWCETRGGVSHGPFRSWYADGQRKTEGAFEHGEAHGEWRSWYETGQVRSRGRYEHGVVAGEWDRFERDGSRQAQPGVVVEPRRPPPKGTTDVIGIPECDEYIERYRTCIEAKAPDATKPIILDALDKTIKSWQEAVAGAGRDTLAETCKMALDAMKKATAAWGCEF